MSKRDDKAFAASWFSAGRTADYVCPKCNASPTDFPEKCNAPLEVMCPGFMAIDKARQEFEAHWERRLT